MKIENITLVLLRNEEFVQFGTDTLHIVQKHEPGNLQIQKEFDTTTQLHQQAESLLKQLQKSAVTASLSELDKVRDNLFRGLAHAIKSACFHFDPTKQEAGERLQMIMNTLGNVARKTYDAESAALNKLVVDAQTKHKADFELLGLLPWIDKIEEANNTFQEAMLQRYGESAKKAEGSLKELRTEFDITYDALTAKLDAYMLITAEDKYASVIKELNVCIARYNNTLAVRKGRKVKSLQDGQ